MKLIAFLTLILNLNGSIEAKNVNGFELDGALVPIEDIESSGVSGDRISSVEHPNFISTKAALANLVKGDRAIVVEMGGEKKVYPISILNWHQVVSDTISGTRVAVTYSPLTGSGIVFLAVFMGKELQFGVSGLFYKSNDLLFDKRTKSLWSQLELKGVSGDYKDKRLKTVGSSNVELKGYLEKNPDALVLSQDTGAEGNYSLKPYPGYEKNRSTYFPVEGASDRYHPKSWSILLDQTFIIPIDSLNKDIGEKVFLVKGDDFSVSWDKEKRELICQSKQDRCITGFFFALSAFYPDADVN